MKSREAQELEQAWLLVEALQKENAKLESKLAMWKYGSITVALFWILVQYLNCVPVYRP
jgi:hypothetical protein